MVNSDAPMVLVKVSLKKDPNMGIVQSQLRNVGFDQHTSEADFSAVTGTIAPSQVENMLTVPYVDAIKVLREIWPPSS